MKKTIIFLLVIFAMIFVGCSNPNNPKEDEISSNKLDTTEQKVQLYQQIQGTYQSYQDPFDIHTFVFTMDSITLDETKYSFNPLKDLYLENEVPESERYYQKTFYMYFNNDYYPIEFTTSPPEEEIRITVGDTYYLYKRISGPTGGESSDTDTIDFSIVGSWNYHLAGSVSTTLSINDNQQFSFTKSSGTSYNGTYELSGNQITFSYETSTGATTVKVDDTFTVSGNADQMTLTLVRSNSTTNSGSPQTTTATSSMLLAFYNSSSTSITLIK